LVAGGSQTAHVFPEPGEQPIEVVPLVTGQNAMCALRITSGWTSQPRVFTASRNWPESHIEEFQSPASQQL